MSDEGPSPPKIRKIDDEVTGGPGPSKEPEEKTELQQALEEIDTCQLEIDGLNEQVKNEIMQIKQSYKATKTPLLAKRSEIIEKLPEFWSRSFTGHTFLSALVDDREDCCLRYMYRMEVEDFPDIQSGYSIKFYFKENPFFENDVLVKEYHFEGDRGSSTSTPINWKEAETAVKPGPKSVFSDETLSSRVKEFKKSFILWFCDNTCPTNDEIAAIIKNDLWINPLEYYIDGNHPKPESRATDGTDTEDDVSEMQGSATGDDDAQGDADDDAQGDANEDAEEDADNGEEDEEAEDADDEGDEEAEEQVAHQADEQVDQQAGEQVDQRADEQGDQQADEQGDQQADEQVDKPQP